MSGYKKDHFICMSEKKWTERKKIVISYEIIEWNFLKMLKYTSGLDGWILSPQNVFKEWVEQD